MLKVIEVVNTHGMGFQGRDMHFRCIDEDTFHWAGKVLAELVRLSSGRHQDDFGAVWSEEQQLFHDH